LIIVNSLKTLFIIRHAKSSWADSNQPDAERPLNDRGLRDAPDMAARLFKRNIPMQTLFYSTARRTTETMNAFRKTLGLKKENCIPVAELYLAPAYVLENILEGVSDAFSSVGIIGHNPGLTEWVNTLTGIQVDNLPTCSIFAVQANTTKWGSFKDAEKTFLFFDYPKLRP